MSALCSPTSTQVAGAHRRRRDNDHRLGHSRHPRRGWRHRPLRSRLPRPGREALCAQPLYAPRNLRCRHAPQAGGLWVPQRSGGFLWVRCFLRHLSALGERSFPGNELQRLRAEHCIEQLRRRRGRVPLRDDRRPQRRRRALRHLAHRQRLPRSFPHHGNDYKDTNYSGGSAPTNRAMAQATCGTAGVSNGYGAVASNPNGDNYITYKGPTPTRNPRTTGGTSSTTKSMLDLPPLTRSSRTLSATCSWSPSTPARPGRENLRQHRHLQRQQELLARQRGVRRLLHPCERRSSGRSGRQGRLGKLAGGRTWAQANASFTLVTGADGRSTVVEDIEAATITSANCSPHPGSA